MHKLRPASKEELSFLRVILNYQLGENIAHEVIPEGTLLKISRNTGKIREIFTPEGVPIASVVAATYTLNLKLYAARRIKELLPFPRLRVVVVNEVAEDVVENESTVFARHVLMIDEELRAGDEVLVVDESDRLLCVGRLVLSPAEVLHFIRGAAVKVRECEKNGSG